MAEAEEEGLAPAWVRSLRSSGATPRRAVEGCANGWATPPGHMFQVRGPHYLENKAKVAGGEAVLKPLAFDWVKCPGAKIFNIMKHPQGRVRQALLEEEKRILSSTHASPSLPFVWAINLQVPSKENHSLVFYYVTWDAPRKGSLLQRFLDGDASFRNSRLKLLANVAAGPWLVKKAVGERGGGACLLGKAVSCVYAREARFMEIDVDIGASLVANAVVHLAFASVTSLTVDLAFVLEGRTPAELPEQILATVRFANLDPDAAPSLPHPSSSAAILPTATPSPPSSNHNVSPTSSSFWRSFSSILHAPHHDPVANVEDDEDDDMYYDADSSSCHQLQQSCSEPDSKPHHFF